MPKKKLLSLEDLYNFYYSQGKNINFSSDDSNTSIVVHIEEPYVFSKIEDDELNLYTNLRLCHTLQNRNKSFISEKSMNDAIPSAYDIPILGYIWHDEENDEDVFASHEFYENENGDTIYEEIPVGIISSKQKLSLSETDSDGKRYLEGLGKIWKTYSKAAEILEREHELSVSIEIVVDELSYDAKNSHLNIDKFRFTGVTILQKDRYTGKKVEPGMIGANISVESFSKENNAIFTKELINELKKFNANFEALNINKQGGQKNVDKFNELLLKYNITAEEVNFEYENLSDEELEAKFAEAFENEDAEEPEVDPEDNGENETEGEAEGSETEENSEESEEDDDDTSENSEDNEDGSDEADNAEDTEANETQTYSLTLPDGTVKTFSLSLNDVQSALYGLVNDTYSELDNDWYSVIVYPDESKVVMESWMSGKCYRQSYKRKKDNFSLEGERITVHQIFVSDDEQKYLDDMKANYSVMESKLQNYETEPEKVELINSEDYAQIRETKEFAEISKRENYFEMSKEDLAKKLDETLLSFAKNNKIEFSAKTDNEPKKVGIVKFSASVNTSTGRGRYGGIFKKD